MTDTFEFSNFLFISIIYSTLSVRKKKHENKKQHSEEPIYAYFSFLSFGRTNILKLQLK